LLRILGDIAQDQNRSIQAAAHYREALSLLLKVDCKDCIGSCLRRLARVASTEGLFRRAVHLFGAAETRLPLHADLGPTERAEYERTVNDLRKRLGEEIFATAWAQGQAMPPEQVLGLSEA